MKDEDHLNAARGIMNGLLFTFFIVCVVGAVLTSASCTQRAEVNEAAVEYREGVPVPPPPPMAMPAPAPPPYTGYRYEPGQPVSEPNIRERGIEAPAEAPEPSFLDVVSQLSWGSFAYSWPDEVNVDERFNVDLRVNPTMAAEELREELGGDQAVAGQVQISRVLIAQLNAPDFDVELTTPARQAVDANQSTQWRWKLKPRSAGSGKPIEISINAVVEMGEERAERFIKVFEGEIAVNVTAQQFLSRWISENWQWAWSALLIPVLAFLWSRRRRIKDGNR